MNATSIAAANLAVMLGAILQASTGLGAGLIIVPLLALVLASMALSGLMAYQVPGYVLGFLMAPPIAVLVISSLSAIVLIARSSH